MRNRGDFKHSMSVSKRANGTLDVATVNTEPSMTQQQFMDECDINNIMAKYEKTGEFLSQTSKQGIYADFSEIQDYQTMLNTVIDAQNAFSALPAHLRKNFDNDPGKLIDFIQDDKNYSEAVKLGLVPQPPPPTQPNEPPIQNQNEPKPKKQSKTESE